MDEDKNWVSVQVLGQGETESMICNLGDMGFGEAEQHKFQKRRDF